jgi:hypothetical protein
MPGPIALGLGFRQVGSATVAHQNCGIPFPSGLKTKVVVDTAGYYPAELNQMFDEYPKSAGAISSKFDHPRLEKARVEFNKAFMELTGLLNRDFEIPDYFLDENRTGRKFYYLLPAVHAKFSVHPQTPEEYAEWTKHKRILDDLVDRFENTHRDLLWAAKMTLK